LLDGGKFLGSRRKFRQVAVGIWSIWKIQLFKVELISELLAEFVDFLKTWFFNISVPNFSPKFFLKIVGSAEKLGESDACFGKIPGGEARARFWFAANFSEESGEDRFFELDFLNIQGEIFNEINFFEMPGYVPITSAEKKN